jgi:hypothetical protein
MVERIQSALVAAGEDIRGFLERAYSPAEPGRFHPALAGLTPAGRRAGLSPSCSALRIARCLGLWEMVDKEEQSAWIAFICSYQSEESAADEPALAGAFLDPELVEAVCASQGRLARWTRGIARDPDPLIDLARAGTRAAVAALAAVDALARVPYRALPTDPARLQTELRRQDWRRPAVAAARSADLIALVMSQGRHYLELTQLQLLREAAAGWLEGLCDRGSGGFFFETAPPRAELLCAAAHVLDAFDWLGRPPPAPDALIDTCLAARPGQDCDVADWARVIHHCLRRTDHRREELRAAAPVALEQLLRNRQPDGGWSLRVDGMATHDGPLEISDGRAGGDLPGTERLTCAAAMLVELLEWDAPRWQILRR